METRVVIQHLTREFVNLIELRQLLSPVRSVVRQETTDLSGRVVTLRVIHNSTNWRMQL